MHNRPKKLFWCRSRYPSDMVRYLARFSVCLVYADLPFYFTGIVVSWLLRTRLPLCLLTINFQLIVRHTFLQKNSRSTSVMTSTQSMTTAVPATATNDSIPSAPVSSPPAVNDAGAASAQGASRFPCFRSLSSHHTGAGSASGESSSGESSLPAPLASRTPFMPGNFCVFVLVGLLLLLCSPLQAYCVCRNRFPSVRFICTCFDPGRTCRDGHFPRRTGVLRSSGGVRV
jgi:hypothetical protein